MAVASTSYGQILRSTAWIGGSSVASYALGIVRTKVLAVLLGPAGVGLLGLYGSIADLAQGIAGMGVNASGVRQIAVAVGSGDTERIARTISVLRRSSLLLGVLGAVLLVVFSHQVSTLTFGSARQAAAVALLSVAVLLRLVAAGQTALLQGLRRISDLAMLGVWGALFGTTITIPVVYVLGEDGVVPALVGAAAGGVLTSWWYSHRVRISRRGMTLAEAWPEAAALLKLGFAFMASALMTLGSAYAIRLIVLRLAGVEAAGLYHAAWALAGLYVAFILQGMGTDFYPRLTAVADEHLDCNRMVNEQAHVSLLLAGPGVIATLTGAPLIIRLFYSSTFMPSVDILRWICLGMMLRVITWPMGYILLAKGEQTLFLATDAAWTVVHVGLAWVFVGAYGLDGAGMAFFGSYVFHALVIYPLVRRLTGFRWSTPTWRAGLIFLAVVAAVFPGFFIFAPVTAIAVGAVALAASAAYSLHALVMLAAPERLPRALRPAIVRVGSAVLRDRP